jgi:dephospho-CoA kinase
MKVIGLTGGIASGKSTVAQFLAELGAVIIDADKMGHLAFKPGTDANREVVAAFGKVILSPNGEVDRKKLSEIVFENYEALSRLNKIMHPRILEMVKKQIEDCRRNEVAVVVLEATLLVEAGWKPLVDELWVTVASEETALRRLKERSRLSEKEALARIRSQPLPGERKKYADVVIDTNCTFKALKAKVIGLWRRTANT